MYAVTPQYPCEVLPLSVEAITRVRQPYAYSVFLVRFLYALDGCTRLVILVIHRQGVRAPRRTQSGLMHEYGEMVM